MRTSSLRLVRDALVACGCVLALACPPVALAAEGIPVPGPDDPPVAFSSTSTKATSAPRAPTRQTGAASTQAVPTPDAPVVATPTVSRKATTTSASRPATKRSVEERPATTRASTSPPTSSTPSTTPRPVAAAVRPRVSAAPALKQAARTAAPARKSKATPQQHLARAPHPTGKPRDAARPGLAVGVLALGGSDHGPSKVLLVAAAILLLAAAAGSTVLGVAARSETREA